MKTNRIVLTVAILLALSAWMAAEDAVKTRTVTFTPSAPVASQQLLFTASGFRTPNLLKWDMGDGTVLTSGGNASNGGDATLAYVYPVAGKYLVRVFDEGGNDGLPSVTVQVTVFTHDRAREKTQEISEKPRSATLVAIPIPAAPPAPAPVRKKYPFIKIGPYAGYFGPQDMWFKKIYGEEGDMIYGARVGAHIWKGLYFWFSASQFKTIAKTTFTEDKTTLTLLPVSAFLRYGIRLGFFNPYVGIGFTYMNFKEESEIGDTTGNGRNTAYESGFELNINRHFIMDFSVRYDLIKVKPTGFEIDLGGLQAGISLLVSF